MSRLKTLLIVIGAATVLVLAGNTLALAATGHSFVLGKKNVANKVTTLKRTTAGSALRLKTSSSSSAPLTVNGRGKVGNLNADLLDGLDSSALKNNVRVFTVAIPGSSPVGQFTRTLPLPPGTYTVSYSALLDG